LPLLGSEARGASCTRFSIRRLVREYFDGHSRPPLFWRSAKGSMGTGTLTGRQCYRRGGRAWCRSRVTLPMVACTSSCVNRRWVQRRSAPSCGPLRSGHVEAPVFVCRSAAGSG
jgi:hypothetical protein